MSTDGPQPDLLVVAGAAVAGGARLLQYRDETADLPCRHAEASALKQLCAVRRVPRLIDTDIELAHAVGADGAHLSAEDDLTAARVLLGPDAILGVACCSSLDLARVAVAAGASHVSFGVFSSPTKPLAAPARIDLLCKSAARRATGSDWRDHTGEWAAAG